MIEFVKLKSVSPGGARRLHLVFSNGVKGTHDCAPMIEEGGPMVEPLRDAAFLARARVDCGAPAWPNGFDLDPTQLHLDMAQAGTLDRVGA